MYLVLDKRTKTYFPLEDANIIWYPDDGTDQEEHVEQDHVEVVYFGVENTGFNVFWNHNHTTEVTIEGGQIDHIETTKDDLPLGR